MKILTLNTHSLIEKNSENKLNYFVSAISKEKPDIICLQEVNQSKNESVVVPDNWYIKCNNISSVKKDNFAYNAIKLLKKKNVNYYWTYLPIKLAFGKYEEGLAVFSKSKIEECSCSVLSENDDYFDWKTRKALGIKVIDTWYYNLHFGWWKNKEFLHQWSNFINNINMSEKLLIMGDFNNSSDIENEGYDLVKKSGFYDTYELALNKDEGFTATSDIDGWNGKNNKIRIDYIWCNRKIKVYDSKVIFNGENYNVVSDHYGIIITI